MPTEETTEQLPAYCDRSYESLSRDFKNGEQMELLASQTKGGILYGFPTEMQNATFDNPVVRTKNHRLAIDGQVHVNRMPSLPGRSYFSFERNNEQQRGFAPLRGSYDLDGIFHHDQVLPEGLLQAEGAEIIANGFEADLYFDAIPGRVLRATGDNTFSDSKMQSYRVTLDNARIIYPDNFNALRDDVANNTLPTPSQMMNKRRFKGTLIGACIGSALLGTITTMGIWCSKPTEPLLNYILYAYTGAAALGGVIGFMVSHAGSGYGPGLMERYQEEWEKNKIPVAYKICYQKGVGMPLLIGALSETSMLGLNEVQRLRDRNAEGRQR
jgi:hypothetical protein